METIKNIKNDLPPTRLSQIIENDQLANEVFELDNWTCRHCGDKASSLTAYQLKDKIDPSEDIRYQLISICIHCLPELERMKKDNLVPIIFIKRKQNGWMDKN